MNNALAVVREKGLPWALYWQVYCNEPFDKHAALPLNGKQNDHSVRGFWLVKPDGSPGMAWHRYRRMFTRFPAGADAIRGMDEIFAEGFAHEDGTNLGPGWSKASHYGVVRERVEQGHLRFEIPDGRAIPWGSATLDLTGAAGRGLRVGEYFELTLRRLSEQGGCGVELFDSDQLRVGGGFGTGKSPLAAWDGTTWTPISFDDEGQAAAFDWNQPHTLGVRFDSADGYRATFSYYLDGQYAGSWLVATGSRTLDKIGVYAQSRTSGSAFEFSDLKVYGKR